ASSADSALIQSVFVHLQFINRYPQDLIRLYIGILTDMNIGNKNDDYVGSDPIKDLTYTYNATTNDSVFGSHPPVQGCQIIDYAGFPQTPIRFGFINFNDNTNNEPIATGPPQSLVEYYRYLIGVWRDGTPLTRGGTGYNPGSKDTVGYVFDGDPSNPFNNGWTEITAGNIPGNRKGLNTFGPFIASPNASICVTLAFPYAHNYQGNNLSSIPLLRERVKGIQDF